MNKINNENDEEVNILSTTIFNELLTPFVKAKSLKVSNIKDTNRGASFFLPTEVYRLNHFLYL